MPTHCFMPCASTLNSCVPWWCAGTCLAILLACCAGAKWLGCAMGMAVGCLLGLTPLIFIEAEPSRHAAEVAQQQQHDQGDAAVAAGNV